MMKLFRITYPTGRITVNIGNFFGLACMTSINGLLKMAKKYCSEEQREQLIKDLKEAKLEIKRIVDNSQNRDGVNIAFIKPFSSNPYWEPRERYQKNLSKQMAQLDKSIGKVQNMVWLGA